MYIILYNLRIKLPRLNKNQMVRSERMMINDKGKKGKVIIGRGPTFPVENHFPAVIILTR